MSMDADALNVGGDAYGSFGRYGSIDVKAGKVIKRSPKGQVTVDFGEVWGGNGKPRARRFTAYGGEIGGGHFYGGRLIDAKTFGLLFERQRAEEAKRAVSSLLRSWSFKNKAELNALVARLVKLAAAVPDDDSTAAQGTEARRAETENTGSVHDGPVGEADAPESKQP